MKSKIALYARVSTKNNGQNPETQLMALRDYAKARDFEVYKEYTDLGISGSKERRPALFGDAEYYSTLFHELVHSTGHSTRLDRFKDALPAHFGSQSYSKEELVAEMGAAFLCGSSGIVDRVIDNSAAYIASWTRRLKKDPKLVVMAAAQAQKAADYIQDVTFD